jgi:hypothetical protein
MSVMLINWCGCVYVCIDVSVFMGLAVTAMFMSSVHKIRTTGVQILPMKAHRRYRGKVYMQDLGLR